MNVAIITLTGEHNYGNKLQNYALQLILEKCGHSVETIRVTSKGYLMPLIKAYFQLPFMKFMSEKRENQIKRRVAFYKFNTHIHQSYRKIDILKNKRTIQKRFKKYDYIVYGSDQIWNTEFSTFSDIYLGMYAPKGKNVAVSASIGTDTIEEKYRDIFKQGFKNFKAISVREYQAVSIIKDLSGLTVERIADPSMVIPKEEWVKIEHKIELPERYLLTYFLGDVPQDLILKIASKYNLMIVTLNNLSEYGPSEFLYLIHHAQFVCTDSFHATVFSIIFEKDIYIYNREDKYSSMNSRITTLLDIASVNYSEEDKCIYINKNDLKNDSVKQSIEHEKDKFYSFINKELI